MNLRTLLFCGAFSFVLAVTVVPAIAGVTRACEEGRRVAEASAKDYKREANCLFKDVESDAVLAREHASSLESLMLDPNVSWQSHALELEYLKAEINDMEHRIAELESMRRLVAPWQQSVIDEIAMTARLMVDNEEDAIVALNASHRRLALSSYKSNVNNLYDEAKSLTHATGEAVQLANVSREYQDLRHELGARPAS